jgi:hypothetical protein
MIRRAWSLLLAVLLAGALSARADDSGSPHTSMDACNVCHNDDMSLQRSKLETCTLCHSETVHSGAAEHLHVDGARVLRALGDQTSAKVVLPLTEDNKIWCGTCHIWHPEQLGEAWLPMGWVPPDSGLPGAVKAGVSDRWQTIAERYGQKTVEASSASKGTRQLRLPIDDGSLCQRCHGSQP